MTPCYVYVQVAAGQLPINHQIIYQLQDVFNLLPDVNLQSFVKSMYVKTNDQMLVVYLASLIRSIIALHNLINNKIQNRDAERNEGKDPIKEKKKEEKEKDSKKDDKEKQGEKKEKEKEKEKKDVKKKWWRKDFRHCNLGTLSNTDYWLVASFTTRASLSSLL